MNFDSLILGLLQGVTEFLPVSSSGHLALAQIFLGWKEQALPYDLALHVATLAATLVYFGQDILTVAIEWTYALFKPKARQWKGWHTGCAVIAGTIVTAPLGLYSKKLFSAFSTNPLILGAFFIITGALLVSSRFIPERSKNINAARGALIGLAQGIATLPAISRSGSTIWAGLASGLSREEAFRFSFLLSIPAILGATVMEAKDLGGFGAFVEALPDGWLAGSAVAFISGLFSLFILKKLVISSRWWMFGVYCALIGVGTIVYFLAGGISWGF